MVFLDPFGGTRGGWVFGLTGLIIGSNVPVFFYSKKSVVKTMIVQDKDIGVNYVTNNSAIGEYFINEIKGKFYNLNPECK